MNWVVYIIKSERDGSFYKGYCENFEARLAAHNYGQVRSTKSKRPWKKHYLESYDFKTDAIKRERFFKSRSGYRWLKANDII